MAKIKQTILEDSFERLAEGGQSTVKQTVKTLSQSGQQAVNQLSGNYATTDKNRDGTQNKQGNGSSSAVEERSGKTAEVNGRRGHTPLDFEKLQNKYDDQDKKKQDELRNRLFQLVKQGDEQVLADDNKQRQEKQQAELKEAQDKKKREEEEKRKQAQRGEALPSGKKRRSIFSPKKKSAELHAEMKPGSSKN